MVIFHSYVSLPDGTSHVHPFQFIFLDEPEMLLRQNAEEPRNRSRHCHLHAGAEAPNAGGLPNQTWEDLASQ